jgi:YidC/Oxa1 family membrane protein insertase
MKTRHVAGSRTNVDDKRNLIMAVLLTGLILFGWPYVAERLFPGSMKPAVQSAPASATGAPTVAQAAPSALKSRDAVLRDSPRILIETPKMRGSIALRGARFDDITLPTYRETIRKDSQPIKLFSPAGTQDAYFAGFGWAGDGFKAPDAATVWQASGPKLTPTTPVTLYWDNKTGQMFEIALSGPIGVFNGAANYSIDFKDLDKSGTSDRLASTGGWIGFTDHYWLAALVPDQKASFDGQFRKGAGETYQADYSVPPVILGPGKSVSQHSRLFVGAKEVKTLEAYQDSGISLFDRAIDWGWFYWFEKPIFALLHWLFTQIGNFGVAIICLTFIVRGLMFPIAQKQFASMAAMRAIQPKMKALQEKHKDDKATLQQEIMDALPQGEGQSALRLPADLPPDPDFLRALQGAQLTIEMRHQPFALWIKDLSAPDPLHVLNLFGLLPFHPAQLPRYRHARDLLGITMWLQFKLNPAPMDPMQQQIFAMMPWIMMFVMAPFAAGPADLLDHRRNK